MKYALINDDKVEATKGAKAVCQYCGSELIAKCGEIKVNHWAHKSKRKCDPWWENETEWHRSWKNKFPKDWQEVIHFDESGEKHIADVKTDNGWAIEFQHSYLKPEERRSRNAFYRKIVWVVNGLRRKTDVTQFERALEESTVISNNPLIREVYFPDECRLLKEWDNDNSLVFFDFQEVDSTKQYDLWFMYPKTLKNKAYISRFPRQHFIDVLNNNEFGALIENSIVPIQKKISQARQPKPMKVQLRRVVPRHKNRRL